jgi:hypothetical protein
MIKPPNAGTLLSPTCVDCRPDSAKRPCKVVNAAKKNVPTHRRDRIGSSVAHLREALSLRGVGCRLGSWCSVRGGAAASLTYSWLKTSTK